jgi:hypothetical protein
MGDPTSDVGATSTIADLVEQRDQDTGEGSTNDAVRHPVAVDESKERPAPVAGDHHIMAGLDLGKQRDPSVLTITEVIEYYLGLFCIGELPSYIDRYGIYHSSEPRLEQRFRTVYTVRHIESMPLETPYFTVAERVCDVLAGLGSQALISASKSKTLFIDNTGVGIGVFEIIKEAFGKRPEVSSVTLRPVTLTYGRQAYSTVTKSVSKHALISRLLQLMGAEIPDLQIPRDLEMFIPALDELRNFQERVAAETGNTSYEGKSGVHDDIVISLCLSVLVDPGKFKVRYSRPIY